MGRDSILPYLKLKSFVILALVMAFSQSSCGTNNSAIQSATLPGAAPGADALRSPTPVTTINRSTKTVLTSEPTALPILEPLVRFSTPSETARKIPTATVAPNAIRTQTRPFSPTPIPICHPSEGFAWAYTYGGDNLTRVDNLSILDNGDILFSGASNAFGDSASVVWVARFRPDGSIVWQNAYPATLGNHSRGATSTVPGRIVITDERVVFAITEVDGSLIWQKSFNEPVAAIGLPDGGFAAISDHWVVKFDEQGEEVWQFDLENEYLYQPTITGEFIFARIFLYDETNSVYRPIFTDIEVLKVRADGSLAWQKTFGKTLGDDEALAGMLVTRDGGLLLAGTHMGTSQFADSDIWVMKLSAGGSLSWQTTLSGRLWDSVDQIIQLPNGEYSLVGTTYGTDEEIQTLVVKFESNGAVAWQKTIPKIGNLQAVIGLDDGGILFSLSDETLLVRLDRQGNLVWDKWYRPNTYLTSLERYGADILLGGRSSGRALMILLHDSGVPSGTFAVADAGLKIGSTMGSRPNRSLHYNQAQISVGDPGIRLINIDVSLEPFCLTQSGEHPRPTLTPTQKPTVTQTPPPTSTPPAFTRALYLTTPPMTGDDVYAVQLVLLGLGYTEVGLPDGVFGALTDRSVRHFQERNGLEVDGVVGPKTWELLFNIAAIEAK